MDLIQILMGGLGSLGFGVLFHIRRARLAIATLGGLMSWTVFLVLAPLFPSEAVRYFFSAAAVTVYAEIFARVVKTPTTTFLVPSLIPLIPGGDLYRTMDALIRGEQALFLANGTIAITAAGAISLGIICMTAVARIVFGIYEHVRSHKKR